MLYGKVLRSPHPHANIKNIDTSKAKKVRGVKAVLTYKDVPEWKGGMPAHVRILDSKVRFVGDAVALVAAETEEIALEALDLIEVEYEPLPAVYDVEEAMKPDAPQLYTQFPGNVLPNRCPGFGPKSLEEIVMGDVEQGFKEADIITEGTYAYENIPNPSDCRTPRCHRRVGRAGSFDRLVISSKPVLGGSPVVPEDGEESSCAIYWNPVRWKLWNKAHVMAADSLCRCAG